MIFLTGDTHGTFTRLLVPTLPKNKDTKLIILGDAGINYYLDTIDSMKKEFLNNLGITIISIQGNHEERPENINTYQEIDRFNGKVYIEEEYPNLIFAKNGEIYKIEDNSFLVIGGAYSVDKYYRLRNNLQWFKDEQLSSTEQEEIFNKVKGKQVDYVLTHTCPYKYIPREAFIEGIDQDLVDNNMEYFLDQIEENIDYKKWYCGHYHISKIIDNLEFMYYDVKELEKIKKLKK